MIKSVGRFAALSLAGAISGIILALLLGLAGCVPDRAEAKPVFASTYNLEATFVGAGSQLATGRWIFRWQAASDAQGNAESYTLTVRDSVRNLQLGTSTTSALSDTLDLALPALRDSTRYVATLVANRTGAPSSAPTTLKWWKHTRPQTPPVPPGFTVDSGLVISALGVYPEAVNLAVNATTQFCAVVWTLDGRAWLTENQNTIPRCRQEYDILPGAQANYPILARNGPENGDIKVHIETSPNEDGTFSVWARIQMGPRPKWSSIA